MKTHHVNLLIAALVIGGVGYGLYWLHQNNLKTAAAAAAVTTASATPTASK